MNYSSRLYDYNRLLGLGLLFHISHLETYQTFLPQYSSRFWLVPGWHNFFSHQFFFVVFSGVFMGAIGLIVKPSRFVLLWICIFGLLDYFTFSFRVVNHYLVILGILWYQLLSNIIFRDSIRQSEKIIFGIRLIFFLSFFSAAVHKLNSSYWLPDPKESFGAFVIERAFEKLLLPIKPPTFLFSLSIFVSVAFEGLAIPIILSLRLNRFLAIIGYLVFWFFVLLTIRGPDYTFFSMILSILLIDESDWQAIQVLGRWPQGTLPILIFACLSVWLFLGDSGWRLSIHTVWAVLWSFLMAGFIRIYYRRVKCAS
ncbi:MAG: hypothetical protein EB078_00820 [Proteobacteria bacterium]|nr:hypothetical protein [Pseudomonadota bacterium]NDC23100.1 hypothetical protein [Pseudomonadota bacterium]NDD03420.1 hypothetical protein [Pseudomonadota bacterium]NDG26383.1 hypothetical protein [Pseudomonadota bacterium]